MNRYMHGLIILLVLGMASGAYATEGDNTVDIKSESSVRVQAGDNKSAEFKARLDAAKNALNRSTTVGVEQSAVLRRDWSNTRPRNVEEMKERQALVKAEIKEIRKERIANRKEFVIKHFTYAIEFLQARQSRIQSFIEKKAGEVKDIDEAKASLQVSIDALAEAKVSLAVFKEAQASDESDAAALRAQAKAVETKLKESRDALIKTLKYLAPKLEVKAGANTETTLQAQ